MFSHGKSGHSKHTLTPLSKAQVAIWHILFCFGTHPASPFGQTPFCIRGHFSQAIPQAPIFICAKPKLCQRHGDLRFFLLGFQFVAALIAEDRVAWIFRSATGTNYFFFLDRLLDVFTCSLKRSVYFPGSYRESLVKLLTHLGERFF